MVQEVFSSNEDAYVSASEGTTNIIDAVKSNRFDEVRKTITKYPSSARQRDPENGFYPLHYAAETNSASMAGLLLSSSSVDADAQDNEGWTALHWALSLGSFDVVEVLINSNASLTIPDKGGLLPFHRLAMSPSDEAQDSSFYNPIVSFILSRIPTLLDTPCSTGLTPLMLACQCGNNYFASCLLFFGANINARDNHGCFPVHWATYSGNVPTINVLLSNGANLWVKDHQGRFPVHIAAKYNHGNALLQFFNKDFDQSNNKFIPALLRKDPCCMSLKDESGNTPLSYLKEVPNECGQDDDDCGDCGGCAPKTAKIAYEKYKKQIFKRLNDGNSWVFWCILVFGMYFNHFLNQKHVSSQGLISSWFSLFYLFSLIGNSILLYKLPRLSPGKIVISLEQKALYDKLRAEKKEIVPYCQPCNQYKPLRSKHCSQCNKCVPLLDHHCSWLHTCIGFGNRKVFIAILITCLIDCVMTVYQFGLYLLSESSSQRNFVVKILGQIPRHPIIAVASIGTLLIAQGVFRLFKSQLYLIGYGVTSVESSSNARLKKAKKFVSEKKMVNIKSFLRGIPDWGTVFRPSEVNPLV
ncbi:hypothetical protein RCL1_006548 [Eukaryota sp. TZLM3-RCL]